MRGRPSQGASCIKEFERVVIKKKELMREV